MIDTINKESILQLAEGAMTFQEFRDMIERLVRDGKTSGDDQSAEKIAATKMNLQRIDRIGRTLNITSTGNILLTNQEIDWTWLVLAEAWCGDAAQSLPVIDKIVKETGDKIKLKILLRDQHLAIMDQFLTNGSRSIPKLVCIENRSGEVLGEWGPRSHFFETLIKKYKADNPEAPKEVIHARLHYWYAKDQGESTVEELVELIARWSDRCPLTLT